MADELKPYWQRVTGRVLYEAAIPIFCSIGWGTFAGTQKHSLIDGLSAAGVGFFLALSLQNQILRVAKHVRDEERAQGVNESLSSILGRLQNIDALGKPVPVAAASKEQTEAQVKFSDELTQLHDLTDLAIQFDRAIYEAALRYGLNTSDKNVRNELIDRLEPYDKRARAEFETIYELRNKIMHRRGLGKLSADEHRLAIERLRRAIRWLNTYAEILPHNN